jgi:hypothetical protein
MDFFANQKRRENIFYAALLLNAVVFPFSEALISIAAGILLLQALVFYSRNHLPVKLRSLIIAFLPVSVFLVYLIGTFFTKDFSFALYELKKVVFWLVVPLAVYFSPKLPDKKVYYVLLVFVAAVCVSSLIVTGKLIFLNSATLSEFRTLSIISHIRFSLQVVLAIIILTWFLINNKKFPIHPGVIAGLILWLFLFLVMLKSLIGIISILGTFILVLFFYAGTVKNYKFRTALILALVTVMAIPVIIIGKVFNDYYNFKNTDPETVEYKTPSGNLYHHDFSHHMRENGNLVYIYICDAELRQEWNKISEIKYDDDLNGYPLGSTLIRYLASLGYRKDSVGISRLSDDDIKLIEKGATNYKFSNHYLSLYPRIYETIWEIDDYKHTKDPNNKTLAQRIEFIKASLLLISENPLFGIGTGNWVQKYNEAYEKMNTKLLREKWSPSHNQYLNYMVKFGVVGFVWILIALILPLIILGHRHNFIFIIMLISIAIANLGDANLETHTGLSFFVFFYSFLLWNSTDDMKKPVVKKT